MAHVTDAKKTQQKLGDCVAQTLKVGACTWKFLESAYKAEHQLECVKNLKPRPSNTLCTHEIQKA